MQWRQDDDPAEPHWRWPTRQLVPGPACMLDDCSRGMGVHADQEFGFRLKQEAKLWQQELMSN